MKTKKITVVPYCTRWQQDFACIRQELQEALGADAVAIEHVGSTAVENLAAKPIIDLDVVIRDDSAFAAVREKLAWVGYRHEGDLGIKGREAFDYTGKEHLQKHHLYVCPADSPELRRHLAFRDYLRAHPEAVREYSRIKQEGAEKHPYDIDGYLAHKTPFILDIYQKCGLI